VALKKSRIILDPIHIIYLFFRFRTTKVSYKTIFHYLENSFRSNRQHKEIVKYLLSRPNWREMMRNAQPIKDTDAYGTPMRKLIRYMPDVALWMIQEKLTKVVGGENQKLYQEIYDYEFYEDMHLVKQWCNDKWG
jgi:hypothetical protein